jgi:hypothetical protein
VIPIDRPIRKRVPPSGLTTPEKDQVKALYGVLARHMSIAVGAASTFLAVGGLLVLIGRQRGRTAADRRNHR